MPTTKRTGKPYIWVTWLAKLLGGDDCLWSAWFKAHHQYEKYETMAGDLVKWSADHDRMMRELDAEFQKLGYRTTTEKQNEFKLEGEAATLAGKADLVARMEKESADHGLFPHTVVVDGKTGRQRKSDWWQVLIYLFALDRQAPRAQLALPAGEISGELRYKRGNVQQTVDPAELTRERRADIVKMIQIIAGDQPPKRVASQEECKFCNIGPKDCPDRYTPRGTHRTDEF